MKLGALLLAVCCLGLAAGAEAPVVIREQPAIAKDFAALPRIASPRTRPTTMINQALQRADQRGRAAAARCRRDDPKNGFWERGVQTTMSGPRFVGFRVADFFGCGGAHPNTAQQALTYDLTTGRPINWASYLPASLASDASLIDSADGAKLGVLRAPALVAWYRAAALKALAGDDPDGCATLYGPDADLALMLWIDEAEGGVAMQTTTLPHAAQACVQTAVASVAELRRLGASAKLTDAIVQAHRAHAAKR